MRNRAVERIVAYVFRAFSFYTLAGKGKQSLVLRVIALIMSSC